MCHFFEARLAIFGQAVTRNRISSRFEWSSDRAPRVYAGPLERRQHQHDANRLGASSRYTDDGRSQFTNLKQIPNRKSREEDYKQE